MLLTIYDKDGTKRADVAVNDSSTQSKEVQGDNVLSLSFSHYAFLPLDVNDYTDYLGERYWLTERYTPKQVSGGEWDYDLKLYGVESLIKRFLVLETTDGDTNPLFTLTATPREHVAMVVKAINDGMGHITDWKTGTVEGTELITIDYEGMYCDEALKAIAEKAGGKVEWWIEGQTVNVCRCEHGEEIALGYGKGLTSLERDTGNTAKFYTRLFPVGSTRNIDAEKYGSPRLMLPGGKKYVEQGVEEYGIHDHYEQEAFSGIYPRRTGTASSVRSEEVTDDGGEKFTIYYFRDSGLDFDPNQYELAGETKRVSFQTGDLAGLGEGDDHYFEVNYDSAAGEFELVTIWPYDDGTQLPGGKLVPRAGDTYILWNIRMPDEYYRLAEEEFAAAVDAYNQEHWLDIATYKAPTDHVYMEEHGIALSVGRRVRLESKKYFPEKGYRQSRITKTTRKVNEPGQMDIEISDALQAGKFDKVADSIGALKSYTKSKTEGVALPDIIRSWENTLPTDNNLFSARRSRKEFISKNQPDEALGLIRFLDGLVAGKFAEGLIGGMGGRIDKLGNAELESLKLRSSLVVKELIMNRWFAQEGNVTYSEAGTIDKVEAAADGTYTLAIRRRWEHDVAAFDEQDVCYGSVNDLAQGGGRYYDAWFRVLSVNRTANTLSVLPYPDNEVPGGKNHLPEAGMVVTRRGNATDEERQGFWYISSYEGCICMLDGVTKPVLEERNYSIIIGKLKRLSLFDHLPINYLHSYVYCRGIAIQDLLRVDYEGRPVYRLNDRGSWSLEVAQGDHPYTVGQDTADTVWHYGCRWRCLVTGTTDEPRHASTGWAMIEGNPEFTIDIGSSAGWAFDGSQLAGDTPFTTLSVTGRLYNRDVTGHILDGDISWTRDTGDVAEDNAWAIKKAGAGKSLPLVADDLGLDFTRRGVCSFKCTAILRDGEQTNIAGQIITF